MLSKSFLKYSFDPINSTQLNRMDEYASFCIQQSNTDYNNKEKDDCRIYPDRLCVEEQHDRDILIEQATNRLRQKVLENKLKSFISLLVEIKSQLDVIKLETSISLQLLPTSSDSIMTETQLHHFEKRFINHITSLKSLIPEKHDAINKLTQTLACSSSSSRNMIYTRNCRSSASLVVSDSANSSSPIPLTVHKNTKSQASNSKTQKNIMSHITSALSACSNYKNKSSNLMESDYSILGNYDHQKRILKRKRLYRHHNDILNYNILSAQLSPTTSPTPSICYSTFKNTKNDDTLAIGQSPLKPQKDSDERNAFDDVISYINNNADDLEFKKDLTQLLYSPLFNYSSQCQPQKRKQNGIFKRMLSVGLKYIKFAIIMFLAVLINIKRGKTSFLRSSSSSNNSGNLKRYRYYPTIVH